MEIIYFLLPASLLLAFVAILAFVWSVKNDQFEDLETPPRRILLDEEEDDKRKP